MAEDEERTRKKTGDEDILGVDDEEVGTDLTGDVDEDYIPGNMNEIREGFNGDKDIDDTDEDLAALNREDELTADVTEVEDEDREEDDVTVGMTGVDEELGEDLAVDADNYVNEEAARVSIERDEDEEAAENLTAMDTNANLAAEGIDEETETTDVNIEEEHIPEDGDEIAEELVAEDDYFTKDDQEAAEEIEIGEGKKREKESDTDKKEIDNR